MDLMTYALCKGNGGGGAGVLVVHENWDGDICTLDKTWQEIFDASYAVIYRIDEDTIKQIGFATKIKSNNGSYTVDAVYPVIAYGEGGFSVIFDFASFTASSASGYPSVDYS